MTTTFKPDDCACRYPAKIFPTGSGHERECLAHQRWIANGKSWRAPEAEDPLRFTDEASELVLKLADYLEELKPNESDFIEGMIDRLAKWESKTYVSEPQIKWLRALAGKFV